MRAVETRAVEIAHSLHSLHHHRHHACISPTSLYLASPPQFVRAGSLLFLNTFGSEIIANITIPLVVVAVGGALSRPQLLESSSSTQTATTPTTTEPPKPSRRPRRGEGELGGSGGGSGGGSVGPLQLQWDLDVCMLAVFLLQGLDVLCSAICVAVQRRHLMVWAIFAPKFVMDGAVHLVAATALVAVRVACS